MIKRSFYASALISGLLLSGALAVPAFAQNYGLKPQGICPPAQQTTTRVYYTPAPVPVVQQQPTYDVSSQAAARPRKQRGFPSPF